MRPTLLLTVIASVVTASAALAASFPATIPLPNGWQPEGIAVGDGTTFYVGSIPTGAVFRGDLRTGKARRSSPARPGRAAIGVEHDRGRLFVAGGGTGKGFVYDADSGALLRELQLATGSGATFVNDVVVTKRAACSPTRTGPPSTVWRSRRTAFRPQSAQVVPLTGDFQLVSGFNLNGIDATPDGKTLVVVQSATGSCSASPPRGVTSAIDLGGAAVPNGDGLLLHGRTLYVVQNRLNRIAVVALDKGFALGRIARTITDSDFDVPTTIDRHGAFLYAVNARFGATPGPSTTYSVVRWRVRALVFACVCK